VRMNFPGCSESTFQKDRELVSTIILVLSQPIRALIRDSCRRRFLRFSDFPPSVLFDRSGQVEMQPGPEIRLPFAETKNGACCVDRP